MRGIKLYILLDQDGDIAVKTTDNKLGVFVRRHLAEKNMHLYNAVEVYEVII